MGIIIFATIIMKRGREQGALRLVRALKRDAEANQPGTRTYLVHRTLDRKTNKATRTLYFYEVYRNKAALNAHLTSDSWKAVEKHWPTYFEGSPKKPVFFNAERIAGFTRPGAIPVARRRKR